jgi:PTH2 family peptidyl-tRNA hydrolase
VGCQDEAELLALHEQAKQSGLSFALIRDSGLTEFNGVPTFTALAVGPGEDGEVDKITGHLKLL